MTEKRFTLKHFEGTDWAYDNGKPIYTKEMVGLLNQLNDENKGLKRELDYKIIQLNRIYNVISNMSKRDLTQTERVFFNTLCKELGIVPLLKKGDLND